MKFIKLEILNLASLDRAGGETIDFEAGALGNSTIFSIVGPTGSGKSTILDAICLALYNNAPRYPLKKGDKNKKIEIFGEPDDIETNRPAPTDPRNILSRGKKEGYSKLTFQANNGCVYRAEWYVRFLRVQYDKVRTSLYKLVAKNGQLIEEPANWEELPTIIGLDYEQFLRTVLIAQGSFANFLTAKEDERYELLEKLIGCEEFYSSIVTKIKEKKDAAVKEYDQIEATFSAQEKDLIPEEELTALKDEAARLEEVEKKAKEELSKISESLTWYSDEDKFAENIKQYESYFNSAKQNIENFKEQSDRLSLHDATLPAVALYKDVLNSIQNIKKYTAALKSLGDCVGEKELAIKEEDAKLITLKETAKIKADEFDKQKPHIKKAREIKAQLIVAQKNENEKTVAFNESKRALAKAQQAVKDNASEIDKAEKAVKSAEENLNELVRTGAIKAAELKKKADDAVSLHEAEVKKLEGKDAGKLQDAKSNAESTQADLENAIRIRRDISAKSGDLNSKQNEQKALTSRNKTIDEELKKFNIEGMSQELDTLNKTYTLMTSENWEMHRKTLVDGDPCPLCGATHHPYNSKEAFLPVAGELKELIAAKTSERDKAAADKTRLEKEKNTNQGKLDGITKNIDTLNIELDNLDNQWSRITSRHSDWPADADSLISMKEDVDKAAFEAEKQLTTYNLQIKNEEKLRGDKDSAKDALRKYQEHEEGLKKEAENKLTRLKTILATEQGKTENLLGQKTEKESAMNAAGTALRNAGEDVKTKTEALKSEIGEKNPDDFENELAKAKESADKAVTEKAERIAKIREELRGVQGQVEATKTAHSAEEEKLTKSNADLDNWLEAYNSDERRLQNMDNEDIAKLYSAADDWEKIRSQQKKLEEAYTTAGTTLKNESEKHNAHQSGKPDEDKDALTKRKAELEGQSNAELVNIKARLQRHDSAKEQMGKMYDEKDAAERLKKDWEEITVAIGTDGKILRKIAQCYTLRFLIEHANVEIRKFNSRYELQQVKNSLGIRVIDHDRADDVRDTTSLSGGETFIVSLGLALGLSSLSSRNISFENLFIDEGFGTLDPDTLATVIDSLAMLQSSQGKKVGVISHTDTMSERITTQIRIIKNGSSGSSHVEIYPQ